MRDVSLKQLPNHLTVPPLYRRHPVITVVIVVLVVAAVLDHVVAGHQEDDYRRYHGRSFRVVQVLDASLVEIDRADRRSPTTLVRLWGVSVSPPDPDEDPPDLASAEARVVATEMLLDREVRLELSPTRTRDEKRRLLAYVYLPSDARSVNELLLDGGSVVGDDSVRHPFARRFHDVQAKAKRRAARWAAERRGAVVE